jgi:hypothetical protein
LKTLRDLQEAAAASRVIETLKPAAASRDVPAMIAALEAVSPVDLVRGVLHKSPAARGAAHLFAAWYEAAAAAWEEPEEEILRDLSPEALREDLMFAGYAEACENRHRAALVYRAQTDPATAAPIIRGQRRWIRDAPIVRAPLGANSSLLVPLSDEQRETFARVNLEKARALALEWRRIAAEGAAS